MNSESSQEPRTPQSKRGGNLVAIAAVAIVAVILALPLFVYGPNPESHDVFQHVAFAHHFNQQFWAGELYPRWIPALNHGLGSPTFFVYPPLPSYVFALLDPVARVLHVGTFTIGQFLTLILSGVFAFLWLRTLAGAPVAAVGAMLYMMAPYHLKANFYQREALAECWAMVWMPLLLCLTTAIAERKRAAVPLFAAAYALFLISNMISAFIFFLVPPAAAFFLSEKSSRVRALLGVGGGMMLGAGLASFYVLPAIANARHFSPEKYIPPLAEYLIGSANLSPKFSGNTFTHTIALTGANAILVWFACGVALLVKSGPAAKRTAWFWVAVCAAPAFMMLRLSMPIWKRLPFLLSTMQYPFRLNMLLCLAAAALLVVLFSDPTWKAKPQAAIRIALALAVVLPWTYSYWAVWKMYRAEANPRAELAAHGDAEFLDDGWFLGWTAKGTEMPSALKASSEARARFIAGSGTATVLEWAPRHIAIATDTPTSGQLMLNLLYFPAWQATAAGSGQHLEASAHLPEGLTQLPAPPGKAEIHLDLPVSPAERAGAWLSAICALLAALLAVFQFRSMRKNPAAAN